MKLLSFLQTTHVNGDIHVCPNVPLPQEITILVWTKLRTTLSLLFLGGLLYNSYVLLISNQFERFPPKNGSSSKALVHDIEYGIICLVKT